MPDEQLQIEYEPMHDIAQWPRNPKDHDVGALNKSLHRNGFVAPMIVGHFFPYTPRLVAGHGRLDALLQAHKRGEPPPLRVLLRDDGEWLVPVVHVTFKSEEDAQAYMLADNQTTILGGWRDNLLAETLTTLALTPAKLEGTGFDEDDLDDLLHRLTATPLEPESPPAGKRVQCPACGHSFPL